MLAKMGSYRILVESLGAAIVGHEGLEPAAHFVALHPV